MSLFPGTMEKGGDLRDYPDFQARCGLQHGRDFFRRNQFSGTFYYTVHNQGRGGHDTIGYDLIDFFDFYNLGFPAAQFERLQGVFIKLFAFGATGSQYFDLHFLISFLLQSLFFGNQGIGTLLPSISA
jgi:hypothetical protein